MSKKQMKPVRMKPVSGWAVTDPHFPLANEHISLNYQAAQRCRKNDMTFCKRARIARVKITEVKP